MTRLLLLVFVLMAPSALGAMAQQAPRTERELRTALDALVQAEDLGNAIIGVSVMDPATGKTLYRHNSDKSLIPASNTKLFTTAAALDRLGPEFRYVTTLTADGDRIEEGVLKANLVVRGSGDPAIGGRFNDGDITQTFRQWADSLKSLGIQEIQGDLIGDDDLFDDLQLGYGWSWDDEPWWYSAEISALSFNDNAVDFTTVPGAAGEPGIVTWEPAQTTYVSVLNATRTGKAGSSLKEGYARERDGNRMTLSSQVPEGYTETESISVHNPTRYFMHVLREELLRQGISVTGRAVDMDDLSVKPANPGALPIATHRSRPLSDIVEVINKRSQNLYAEQLLKTLGAAFPDSANTTTPGSAAAGWLAAVPTLATAGVDTSRVQLVDGSGLSRLNLATSDMTAHLLRHMWNHPDDSTRAAFYRSLPIAGVDGTLEYRMRGTPAQGNVRAKTGTVGNVSALSGYVTTAGGTPLVFAVMVNHYTGSSAKARRMQDSLAQTLARYGR